MKDLDEIIKDWDEGFDAGFKLGFFRGLTIGILLCSTAMLIFLRMY